MADAWITLYNHFTYNLSFAILLHFFTKTSVKKVLIFFGFSFISLLMSNYLFLIMPVFLLLGVGYFYQSKQLWNSVFQVATPMFLCIVISLLIGSVFTLTMGKTNHPTLFNLVVGMGLVVSCFGIHRLSVEKITPKGKHRFVLIVIELVVTMFFTFGRYLMILPNMGGYSVVGICIVIILLSVGCLSGQLTVQQSRTETKEQYIHFQREQIYLLTMAQEEVFKLKHYYDNLYRSIYPLMKKGHHKQATAQFERYITPLHQAIVEKNDIATSSPLISEFLLHFKNRVHFECPSVFLKLNVSQPLNIAESYVLDLFKIMSVTTENALTYLKQNQLSLVIIELSPIAESGICFSISNEVLPTFSLSELKGKVGFFEGYGLKIIEDITQNNSRVEYSVQTVEQCLTMCFYLL